MDEFINRSNTVEDYMSVFHGICSEFMPNYAQDGYNPQHVQQFGGIYSWVCFINSHLGINGVIIDELTLVGYMALLLHIIYLAKDHIDIESELDAGAFPEEKLLDMGREFFPNIQRWDRDTLINNLKITYFYKFRELFTVYQSVHATTLLELQQVFHTANVYRQNMERISHLDIWRFGTHNVRQTDIMEMIQSYIGDEINVYLALRYDPNIAVDPHNQEITFNFGLSILAEDIENDTLIPYNTLAELISKYKIIGWIYKNLYPESQNKIIIPLICKFVERNLH